MAARQNDIAMMLDDRRADRPPTIPLAPLAPPSAAAPAGRAESVRAMTVVDLSGPRPAAAVLVGLLFVLAGSGLAMAPAAWWSGAVAWIGQAWNPEIVRWGSSVLLLLAGLSILRSNPISVMTTSALVGSTLFAVNALAEASYSRRIDAELGEGAWRSVLVIVSLAAGYLVHASPRLGRQSVRGIIGLAIVWAAGFGVVHGWYDCAPLGDRLGDGAAAFVRRWGPELTWGVVIVLAAVGVSCSRTRPIHFLQAMLLAGLAYHCVRGGYVEIREFPDLDRSIDYASYTNVDLWRWVVALEFAAVAAVLLHRSMGIGALNIAFAVAWMVLGGAIYRSVGNISLVRTATKATVHASAADPLADMGLPLVQAAPGGGAASPTAPAIGAAGAGRTAVPAATGSPTNEELAEARGAAALDTIARQTWVTELTPLGWMYLIAVLAGLIAASGLRTLSENAAYRAWTSYLLWFGFGVGSAALWSVWPRDPDQSWESWLAAFRLSRHHFQAIWLAFVGATALAGSWALRRTSRDSTWVQVPIVSVFLGTGLTLTAAAVMIRLGGLSPLPVWVYAVVAAGQSSLAWVLMMHSSLGAARGPQGAPAS